MIPQQLCGWCGRNGEECECPGGPLLPMCPFQWRLCAVDGTPVRTWSCSLNDRHDRHEVWNEAELLFWWIGEGHADVSSRRPGLIPQSRQAERLMVTRDAWGRAIIAMTHNGMPYELLHSRDFSRDAWTALVEAVTDSGSDTAAREALRMSPAERNQQ